ncbi:MAG: hypothetical protein ACK5VH_05615, partial [bacterium]
PESSGQVNVRGSETKIRIPNPKNHRSERSLQRFRLGRPTRLHMWMDVKFRSPLMEPDFGLDLLYG